ncbi:MAG: hypothetical protein CSA94_01540 [Bacteroidetes bacterium]|nr:MAG: hypothetical protein CSA94_01540 [Bacteroidota bacterium]
MKNHIFTEPNIYGEIEEKIKQLINTTPNIVNSRSLSSPRAVGDALQDLLEKKFPDVLPTDILKNYTSQFARRAMADFAFEDINDYYYVVDAKTHNLDTKFNMPNLTSVERLSRFYEEQKNYFTLLMTAYEVVNDKIIVADCFFLPIEHLKWDCLTIGALGWGQIQIANSNNIIIDRTQTRKEWMLTLCDTLFEFYPKEISKITSRIDHFKRIREYWENQPNI